MDAEEMERGRLEAKERMEKRERQIGNLTEDEIQELSGYEFDAGPDTVRKQVRRYFLKLKSSQPEKAGILLENVEPFLQKKVETEQEVYDLSIIIAEFFNGVIIHPELTPEVRAEMEQKFPLPLKTLTTMAENPYQRWDGYKSQMVQWKAWRQGRPTVCGYGMTEQEAIDDLRYCVQPDHHGTLDGLGTPEGPIVGGNMFPREDVIRHNKGRFA